jgi:hypothetical protein
MASYKAQRGAVAKIRWLQAWDVQVRKTGIGGLRWGNVVWLGYLTHASLGVYDAACDFSPRAAKVYPRRFHLPNEAKVIRFQVCLSHVVK